MQIVECKFIDGSTNMLNKVGRFTFNVSDVLNVSMCPKFTLKNWPTKCLGKPKNVSGTNKFDKCFCSGFYYPLLVRL